MIVMSIVSALIQTVGTQQIEPKSEPASIQLLETPVKAQVNTRILSRDNVQRSEVESKTKLALGTQVKVHDMNGTIGTLSLDKVEVIANEKGFQEKSIVLHFTETNESDTTLSLGINQPDTLLVSHLFKDETYLDAFLETDKTYFKTLPRYDQETLCHEAVSLAPHTSRRCYNVYSYAGPGRYIVSVATTLVLSEHLSVSDWKSYEFDVE